MSQHLEHMNVGDTIDVRGPSGKLEYNGKGVVVLLFDWKPFLHTGSSTIVI